ncbi:uncharacterized protein LOC125842807 [Solanum stenotomum]|uniref:uncharacterized protein LOC125842807 n=1 Tax=Solanum stenotomum TaxID=172797 RepID=UPI0020D14319|nr:uncharacterized protein LOC125842807 [Solanum stenotomum]
MASRLRDLTRMSPLMLFGSKVNEDPQEFVEEIYKIVDAMGMTSIEKAELATYQFKDVAQVWYNQWKDNRTIGAGPIDWEVFKKAFLDKFFPREKREAKVEEFINLCKGGMSVQEYSLKFTMFSKYTPSLVSNLRDEMSQFVTSVSDSIEEECCAVMLHDNMDISCLMVYAQQVEDTRPRKKYREYGKKHDGKCLAGMGVCYGCGKTGHQLKYCPIRTAKGRDDKQTPPSVSNSDTPKKNRFYALQSRGDQESSPDVVTVGKQKGKAPMGVEPDAVDELIARKGSNVEHK